MPVVRIEMCHKTCKKKYPTKGKVSETDARCKAVPFGEGDPQRTTQSRVSARGERGGLDTLGKFDIVKKTTLNRKKKQESDPN